MPDQRVYAKDSTGSVFEFDPTNPNVKKWERSGLPPEFNCLYLLQGQWYCHSGNWMGDVLGKVIASQAAPNYARFRTREEARDWFLAGTIPIPDELADLRPATEPSRPTAPEGRSSIPQRIDILSHCWKFLRQQLAQWREQYRDDKTRRWSEFSEIEIAVRHSSGLDADWLARLKPVAPEHVFGVAMLREFVRAETGRGTHIESQASQAARQLLAAAEEQKLAEGVLRWLAEDADRELTQALLASTGEQTTKTPEKQEAQLPASPVNSRVTANAGPQSYDPSKTQPRTWWELERWGIAAEVALRPGSMTPCPVSLHSPQGSVLDRITTYLQVELRGINVETIRELRRHYCKAASMSWGEAEQATLAEIAGALKLVAPAPEEAEVTKLTLAASQSEKLAPVIAKSAMKTPPDAAVKAYRLKVLLGVPKQAKIADMLSKELGKPVTQGQVSRWLQQAQDYLSAGGVLPDLPDVPSQKPIPVDPERLDLGPRRDGRPEHQRERRSEDE